MSVDCLSNTKLNTKQTLQRIFGLNTEEKRKLKMHELINYGVNHSRTQNSFHTQRQTYCYILFIFLPLEKQSTLIDFTPTLKDSLFPCLVAAADATRRHSALFSKLAGRRWDSCCVTKNRTMPTQAVRPPMLCKLSGD